MSEKLLIAKAQKHVAALLKDLQIVGGEEAVARLDAELSDAEERGRRAGVEEAAKLRDALQVIAAGSSGYRGGGGYFCNWCDGAGSEEFADRHPDRCPRTIARKALAALAPRDSGKDTDHG